MRLNIKKMKINLGTINKFSLKPLSSSKDKIPFFDDLILYYTLNEFIPEITINEELEILKHEKYWRAALKINILEFINVTIRGDLDTLLFSKLIKENKFYQRDIKDILKKEKETKFITEWECYKLEQPLTAIRLKELFEETIDFYKDISCENIVENFNFDIRTNTFYFKKTQKIDWESNFNEKFKEFLKKISLKYTNIMFVNGLVYDWYINPSPKLGI